MWDDGTIQELLEKYECPMQETPTELDEEYDLIIMSNRNA